MLDIVIGKGIKEEEKEIINNTLVVPQFYYILNSLKDIMRDREIFASVSLEREYLREPLYFISLEMKFNDNPNKCYEILARAIGADLLEVIVKFNFLLLTTRAMKYAAGRVDGEPYNPFPMATKNTSVDKLIEEVEL